MGLQAVPRSRPGATSRHRGCRSTWPTSTTYAVDWDAERGRVHRRRRGDPPSAAPAGVPAADHGRASSTSPTSRPGTTTTTCRRWKSTGSLTKVREWTALTRCVASTAPTPSASARSTSRSSASASRSVPRGWSSRSGARGDGPRAAGPARPRLGLPQPAAAPARAGRPRRVVPTAATGAAGGSPLTAAAGRRWPRLDRRSEDAGRSLLSPLTDRQRTRLVEALATAELLVRAATVDLESRRPDRAGAVEALDRYFGELDRAVPDRLRRGRRRRRRRRRAGAGHGTFVVATERRTTGGLRRRAARSTTAPARSSGCGCIPTGAAPGSAPGCSATWRQRCRRPRARRRPSSTPTARSRGDRDVRASRLPPDRALQRQPLRPALVRERASRRRGC